MTISAKRTIGFLFGILAIPFFCGATECFQGYWLDENTALVVSGNSYSNCFVEIVQDSTGLWLSSVELATADWGTKPGLGQVVSDLESHPFYSALMASGMAGIPALQETVDEKNHVAQLVVSALANAGDERAFSLVRTNLQNSPTVLNFGVELKWDKRLGQAFYKILPCENWRSVQPRELVVSKIEWDSASEIPWCGARECLESVLSIKRQGLISAVEYSGGSFRRQEFSSWLAFEKSLDSN